MYCVKIINGVRCVWSIMDNAWVPETHWDYLAAEIRVKNLVLLVALRERHG